MRFTPRELKEALLRVQDWSWFTEYLCWERRRYVVGFTNNEERSIDLLTAQANFYVTDYAILTVGWWTNKHWAVLIDIGTAVDEYDDAIELWKRYHQVCIYDSLEDCTIDIEYN